MSNPHDNLPAGADTDPNAPWNQCDDLCRNCDKDVIQQQYRHVYPLADETDDDGNLLDPGAPEIEDYVYSHKLCRGCHEESKH
jgi:hypothetical protein